MIRENLAYLKKSSDVRRCCVFVVIHTAAMTSPLINLNLAVISQQTRTRTERRQTTRKVSETLERKSKRHFEQ